MEGEGTVWVEKERVARWGSGEGREEKNIIGLIGMWKCACVCV